MKTTSYLSGAILLLLLITSTSFLNAQILDSTFRSPKFIRPADIVYALPAPNGDVYMAGDINFYNGTPVKRTVRLNADGSLDRGFEYPSLTSYLSFASVYENEL